MYTGGSPLFDALFEGRYINALMKICFGTRDDVLFMVVSFFYYNTRAVFCKNLFTNKCHILKNKLITCVKGVLFEWL